jgi:hypothetical protein
MKSMYDWFNVANIYIQFSCLEFLQETYCSWCKVQEFMARSPKKLLVQESAPQSEECTGEGYRR